ncbi:MAG: hypothetical protein ACFFG0_26750, partial [Candidatus Thorarchaeota archaeon]
MNIGENKIEMKITQLNGSEFIKLQKYLQSNENYICKVRQSVIVRLTGIESIIHGYPSEYNKGSKRDIEKQEILMPIYKGIHLDIDASISQEQLYQLFFKII